MEKTGGANSCLPENRWRLRYRKMRHIGDPKFPKAGTGDRAPPGEEKAVYSTTSSPFITAQ